MHTEELTVPPTLVLTQQFFGAVMVEEAAVEAGVMAVAGSPEGFRGPRRPAALHGDQSPGLEGGKIGQTVAFFDKYWATLVNIDII